MKASMRLKVKGDTFFIPDPRGGVYFRNNTGSFRMEGEDIEQWLESLMPELNGEHTMEELTDDLPEPYQKRIHEIADVLYGNGFVRDVSQDREHQLDESLILTYKQQIDFLDSFGGSGAYRFQTYRQGKVLAVGSGPFLVSLCAALLESGLPHFQVLILDPDTTNRQRLSDLAASARRADPVVNVELISPGEGGPMNWSELVTPYDAVLYVASNAEELDSLWEVQSACREERKVLLPALFVRQTGMAGPLVRPDSSYGLGSAWRRIHEPLVTRDPELHTPSSTAQALLANVIVLEWFKASTGVTESHLPGRLFLLNLETLEGSWHAFLPHPLEDERQPADTQTLEIGKLLEPNSSTQASNGLLQALARLTSPATGILHLWEEGELKQLPLSLCRVQAADPLSAGPATLLPELVCAGMTHEEARREAGLAGIEAYVSRLAQQNDQPASPQSELAGIGTGETAAEAVCRALQHGLTELLANRTQAGKPTVTLARLNAIEDSRCNYYLQVLSVMQGTPEIGVGEDVAGFPVFWVRSQDSWFGGVGLTPASALRNALQLAVMKAQLEEGFHPSQAVVQSRLHFDEKQPERMIAIGVDTDGDYADRLRSALQVLQRQQKRIQIDELPLEPFLNEKLAGAYRVTVREEVIS